MNTEQEHAAFEAWAGVEYRHADKYTKRDYYMGLAAWKAGRAALQSQDREDAQRYRWLRDNVQLFSHFGEEGNSGWCVMRRDSAITRIFTYNHAELDEAIDHARRVEEVWDGWPNNSHAGVSGTLGLDSLARFKIRKGK